MQQLLLTLVYACLMALAVTSVTSCDNDLENENISSYYWFGNEKIPLQIVNDKIRIAYYTENEDKIKEELSNHNISLSNIVEGGDWDSHFLTENAREFLHDYKYANIEGDYRQANAALKYTIGWSPFYISVEKNKELTPSMTFCFKMKQNVELEDIQPLIEQNNVLLIGNYTFIPETYTIWCTSDSKGNVLQIANRFYESGLFEFAEPCFAGILEFI